MHIIDIELLSFFQCTRATIGTTYHELCGLFSQSNNTNAVRGIGNIVQIRDKELREGVKVRCRLHKFTRVTSCVV